MSPITILSLTALLLTSPDALGQASWGHLAQKSAFDGQIAARRASYVAWIIEHFGAMEPQMDGLDSRRWALNHARLVLNRDLEKANRYFQSAALTKDSDIYFIRFLKTLLDFQDSSQLSGEAKKHLAGILTSWPSSARTSIARWPAHHTENHDLMQLTIGMFAEKYRGKTVSRHVREIKKSLAWRFERGWIEWNSPCYQFHYSNPLIVLAEHAPSSRLRQGARDLLNVLLAERALLGINGYLGGPAFRCRTTDATHSLTKRKVAYLEDNRYNAFLPTVWLALGLGEPRFDFQKARVPGLQPATVAYASGNEPRLKQDEGMFYACSSLQPHPIVVALATEASTRSSLVYQGRRYLGWPGEDLGEKLWATQRWMPGALYYYNTPHVSMGSIHSSGWICQSRYCSVTFAAEPSQNLRVEMILPGVSPHKRRYEARGRVVQHKNWLLGQGTLFEDGSAKSKPIGPWNLYQVGKGLCAHLGLPDSYHILQVSDLDTFATGEAFIKSLSVPAMDAGQVRAMIDGDGVMVDLKDMSISINGQPRPHPPKMLHDCGPMRSEYGSGKITISTGAGSVTFDSADLHEDVDNK
jgi:hypothetical protein